MKNKCKNCKKVNRFPGKYCEYCGQETGIRAKRYAAFQTVDRTFLQRGESHFPTGDETVRAFVYKKRKAPAIIAALLIIALLAGTAFGGYYFDVWSRFMPRQEVAIETYYHIADGRSISTPVINASAAKSAINEVKNDFGIRDSEIELAESGSTVIASDTYYRFAEMYESIPVFGHSMVVHANQDGAVYSITGNFCPLSDLSVTPSLPKEKATKKLSGIVRSQFSFHEDTFQTADHGLCIYAPNSSDAALAYSYSISGVTENGNYECYDVLLSAKNGALLYQTSTQKFFELAESGDSETPRVVQVEGDETSYQFVDAGRNIQVYAPMNNDLTNLAVLNNSDDSDPSVSFDALYNAAYTYDYYKSVLGLSSYDGQDGALSLITNIPETNHTFDTASAFASSIAFFPISSNQKSAAGALDIVGHEYTHLVLSHLVGEPTTDNAQSVFEAFCDIMGNIIEHKNGAEDSVWDLGEATGNAKYSMQSPTDSGHANTVSGYDPEKTPEENASIWAHAAYLTYEGASCHGYAPADTAIADFDLLGKLWYRAMLLLPEDATFESAASALRESAETMYRNGELTVAQLFGVDAALEAIGVQAVFPTYQTSENPTVSVLDSINAPYQTGVLTVTDRETHQEVLTVNIETDRTELKLAPGHYLLTLTDRDAPDQNPIYHFGLDVGASEEEMQEELPTEFSIYTWYNAKDYIDVLPGGALSVTGTIVGEKYTNEAGVEQIGWVVALNEPMSIRLISEDGTIANVYNDQVALGIVSDHVDFSGYAGMEVTVSGIVIQKYSDIHLRDVCLEDAYIGSAASDAPATDSAESGNEETTESPQE